MRADRLVAILLLLQVHGRMTVPQLAAELETSERTIRRDLEALSFAGVPVYSQRGRGGGWHLLGGHRIDLSGLTANEAQALLLATDPGAVTPGPGLAEGLVAARRKVLAALPPPLRAQADAATATVLIDPTGWGHHGEPEPQETQSRDGRGNLVVLREAVRSGLQVVVVYEPPGRPAGERRLHPHGLVCKRGVWYLVATAPAGLRTYRVSRVREVRVTEEPVIRPPGFDLAATWAELQEGFLSRIPAPVVVRVSIEAALLGRLRATVGSWWPVEEGPLDEHGRAEATMRFPSAAVAARELVGLAGHMEVLSPDELRSELASIGRQLVERYGPPAPAR